MNTSINNYDTQNVAAIANDIITWGVEESSWTHILSATPEEFATGAEIASKVMHSDELDRLNLVMSAKTSFQLSNSTYITEMTHLEKMGNPFYDVAY